MPLRRLSCRHLPDLRCRWRESVPPLIRQPDLRIVTVVFLLEDTNTPIGKLDRLDPLNKRENYFVPRFISYPEKKGSSNAALAQNPLS